MPTNTFVALQTQTLGSAVSSVTFTGIDQTYTDLVLVADTGQTVATANSTLRFNSDSGSNYSDTKLYGTGSAAGSNRDSNQTGIYPDALGYGSSLDTVLTLNIQNYTNTNTHKTAISRCGSASIGTSACVGLWRSTAAINSITLSSVGYNFLTGSTFTIYGIKCA